MKDSTAMHLCQTNVKDFLHKSVRAIY